MSVRVKSRVSPSHISELIIAGSSREGERFENLRLDAISISESHLTSCAFVDVHAESVSLGGGKSQSIYSGCTFENCDFHFFAVGNVRLENCNFIRCRLLNMLGPNLEVIGSSFHQTTLKKAVFHGKVTQVFPGYPARTKNEFYGNDFSSAELIDVGFRSGIALTEQKLPTDEDYIFIRNVPYAVEILKGLNAELSELSAKQRAQGLVRLLEFNLSMGQTTHLLHIAGWGALGEMLRQRFSAQTV